MDTHRLSAAKPRTFQHHDFAESDTNTRLITAWPTCCPRSQQHSITHRFHADDSGRLSVLRCLHADTKQWHGRTDAGRLQLYAFHVCVYAGRGSFDHQLELGADFLDPFLLSGAASDTGTINQHGYRQYALDFLHTCRYRLMGSVQPAIGIVKTLPRIKPRPINRRY